MARFISAFIFYIALSTSVIAAVDNPYNSTIAWILTILASLLFIRSFVLSFSWIFLSWAHKFNPVRINQIACKHSLDSSQSKRIFYIFTTIINTVYIVSILFYLPKFSYLACSLLSIEVFKYIEYSCIEAILKKKIPLNS